MAKEVHKLQQLNDGDTNPHIQQLSANISGLYDAHNELVTACNANWRLYSDQIQHLDIRVGAAYSALQDLVDSLALAGLASLSESDTAFIGKLLVVRSELEGVQKARVDWATYMKNHMEVVQVELQRVHALRESIGETAKLPLGEELSPLVTPKVEEDTVDEPDTVFGGDHEQAQQANPA